MIKRLPLCLFVALAALCVAPPLWSSPASRATPSDPPEAAYAHKEIGNGDTKLGRYEDAIREYKEALRIYPRYADAYCNWGIALLYEGHNAEAAARLRQCLAIDSAHAANGYYSLGLALYGLGKTRPALGAFLEAIRQAPRIGLIRPLYASACYHAAFCYAQLGQNGQAAAQDRHALRLDPHCAWAHDGLSESLCAQGRFAQSLAEQRAAVRGDPTNAVLHYHLAGVLDRQGRRAQARGEWQRAATLPGADAVTVRDAQECLQRFP